MLINRKLYETVNRYFIQHALSWLSPHNAAVSLHSENPPFTKEALTLIFHYPKKLQSKICCYLLLKEQ